MKTRNGKVVLMDKFDYNLFMDVMDVDKFFDRFEVSGKVVTSLAAEAALTYLDNTDAMLLKSQRRALVRGTF